MRGYGRYRLDCDPMRGDVFEVRGIGIGATSQGPTVTEIYRTEKSFNL